MFRADIPSMSHSISQSAIEILKGNRAKTKSITKSFRLDEDTIRKIDEQARNNSASLNTEINSILKKYVEWDMLAGKVGMIPISRSVLSEIFQNIMTKDQVIDLADKVAKNVILEAVHFMKGSLTLESFLSWLKTRMEHCSNVNYIIDSSSNGGVIKIIFKHDMGENWSLYHKIIAMHVFNEMLHVTNIGAEASDTMLTLYLKR